MADLLDALAAHDDAVGLKRLAAETGLHTSTAHRILGTLVDIGYVERGEGGGYRLGMRLLQLGGRVRLHVDVRREALPIMEALRDAVGETVNLTVRESDEVVYVERVSGVRNMRVELVIGGRAPLHVTAVGKLFLGEDGPEGVERYAARGGLPAFTARSLTSASALREAVETARGCGFARDTEETEEGVACLGAAVRDASGRMVAGLSVSAPAERLQEAWVSPLLEASDRLSRRLGFVAARSS